MNGWVLAVDIGSGGPKTASVGCDGTILRAARRSVPTHVGVDGTATQDAEEWWRRLGECVREVVPDPEQGRPRAIGVTGQWGSTVPVDASARPVGPVLMWADTRAEAYSRAMVGGRVNVAGYSPRRIARWLWRTGGAPSPMGSDPTGHWQLLVREFPDVAASCAYAVEPVDYLTFRMTGTPAATPASMILSWLTDNRGEAPGRPPDYDSDLIRRAGRDPRTLPPLRPTGSVQGTLTADVARDWWLSSGIPVVTGIPDLHAAVVGSGRIADFQSHVAISTTGWFSAPVPFQRTDILHTIATVPGLTPGSRLVADNIETAGAALSWMREQVIAPDDGLLGGGSGIGASGAAPREAAPTFDEIIALAEGAPRGCEGVLFTPWLAGERSPVDDRNLRAAWLGLGLRTDRATLVRSVLEGVALNARWLMEPYESFLGRSVPDLALLGGGAQSDLWCQILADVLRVPLVRVSDPRDAQLRGVALWALAMVGDVDLGDAVARVPHDREFLPEPEAVDTYRTSFEVFRRVRGRLGPLYRRLRSGGAPR